MKNKEQARSGIIFQAEIRRWLFFKRKSKRISVKMICIYIENERKVSSPFLPEEPVPTIGFELFNPVTCKVPKALELIG